jgi:hypothetical protein
LLMKCVPPNTALVRHAKVRKELIDKQGDWINPSVPPEVGYRNLRPW